MHDCVGKRIAQLPFATPHQNSVLQCILGHLAKFIQVLIEYLDFFRTGNDLAGRVLPAHRPRRTHHRVHFVECWASTCKTRCWYSMLSRVYAFQYSMDKLPTAAHHAPLCPGSSRDSDEVCSRSSLSGENCVETIFSKQSRFTPTNWETKWKSGDVLKIANELCADMIFSLRHDQGPLPRRESLPVGSCHAHNGGITTRSPFCQLVSVLFAKRSGNREDISKSRFYCCPRRRSALATTLTDDRLIAAAAITGDSTSPKKG